MALSCTMISFPEYEERLIAQELSNLLIRPEAEYVAEECRYTVNIFEKKLGIHNEMWTFSFGDTPSLEALIHRLYHAGILASLPNTAQVNEFTGPYSGYQPHRKNTGFGPYLGILNLISKNLVNLRHIELPWAPSVLAESRSLLTVTKPALLEYKIGTANPSDVYKPFRMSSRHTRDYRIEVLLASVDLPQIKYLNDAANITNYSESKTYPTKALNPVGSEALNSGITLAKGLRGDEVKLLYDMKAQTEGSRPKPF